MVPLEIGDGFCVVDADRQRLSTRSEQERGEPSGASSLLTERLIATSQTTAALSSTRLEGSTINRSPSPTASRSARGYVSCPW